MEKFEYIVRNPKILGGKPIINGTRISVEFILELIRSGGSVKDIVALYPHLKEIWVEEAISYALFQLKNDIVYEIPIAA